MSKYDRKVGPGGLEPPLKLYQSFFLAAERRPEFLGQKFGKWSLVGFIRTNGMYT
jgi:hypothetical protein